MRASSTSNLSAKGFSLVELMVAIALSLLLLTGVVAIFSSSRVSYESTEQLSRVQETGRFALEAISRQVRTAGFGGCARQPNYISTALRNSTALQWDFTGGAVRGYNASGTNAWTPAIDASVTSPASDSDVLAIRGPRMDAEPARVSADMTDPQLPLVVTNGGSITAGDVVMAYSCEGQSFFHVTGLTGGLQHDVSPASATAPSNEFATTNYPFRINAEVVPVETVVYYVRASTGAGTTLPAGTNSLWRRRGLLAAEELVEGVEQMQVEYGLDIDGDRVVDGDYQAATATTNWQRVIAVRIALLIRSIDQYGTDRDLRTYQLLSATTVNAPGDRRTREVFTATVSMRNRVRVD
jgi:type IV pilus assembly protein PilW